MTIIYVVHIFSTTLQYNLVHIHTHSLIRSHFNNGYLYQIHGIYVTATVTSNLICITVGTVPTYKIAE